MKQVIAPLPAMTIGTATHDGVEHGYLSIWQENKYKISDCTDIARDKIEYDDVTEWVKIDKESAKDKSVNMITAYSDKGYLDNVRQDEIVGIELKKPLILKQQDGELVKILGVADLVLDDKIIDFKTSGRKMKTANNYNRLQCSIYAYSYGKEKAAIHAMNHKKSGADANDFDVPIMPLGRVNAVMAGFWRHIKELYELGYDDKDLIRKFNPTGLVHDWACSYCGFGRMGLCKHYNKTEV